MTRTLPTVPLPSVLIVDNEVRLQEALRRTLDEDFEVFTASSAADALFSIDLPAGKAPR